MGYLIIIGILWCIFGLLTAGQYAQYCAEIEFWKKVICATVFFVGGPFFAIVQIFELILDSLLPEGWDNDG